MRFCWVLDVAFFLILFVGIFIGAKCGFINIVSKIFGKIFAVILALTFCVSLQNAIDRWWGLSTVINNATRAPVGNWIMTVVCFLVLGGVGILVFWLIGKLGTAIVNLTKPVRILNIFLGGIIGGTVALVAILFALAITFWIPNESLHEFMSGSMVVGKLYISDWFVNAVHFRSLPLPDFLYKFRNSIAYLPL